VLVWGRQASGHELDHADLDYGFAGFRGPPVIFTVAASAAEPSERASTFASSNRTAIAYPINRWDTDAVP